MTSLQLQLELARKLAEQAETRRDSEAGALLDAASRPPGAPIGDRSRPSALAG
jgi:hypothetical protein